MLKTIGIIGGGQLARMICFAAHQLGFKTVILTDQLNSPASQVTDKTIVADYLDKNALQQFANLCDVITFEFENIPFESADFLVSLRKVYPNPKILRITQNRILEKNFINEIAIQTADYKEVKNVADLKNALEKFDNKAILKTATLGYDGKGQVVIDTKSDLDKIWQDISRQEFQQFILEKFCPFDCEISVIVARSQSGEIACYEPLRNIHKNGILDESHYPANITLPLTKQAQDIAIKIAQSLDLIGVMAVEMFVVKDKILVNELATRPHNSGHFSMDAAITTQFEQMIRAITNMPLGSTKYYLQGYMKNLIGSDVDDLKEIVATPNAKLHLYGKEEVKAGRKMGHVNFVIEKSE